MFRASNTRKLQSVSREISEVREALRVVDDQLVQLREEAEDAHLRSLVSDAVEASQDHKQASKALEAAQRHRNGESKRLKKLEAKLDSLLDSRPSETE